MNYDIIVNNSLIHKYLEPETNKIFVEGRKGSEYSLRISNNTNIKKRLVVSVDGLNVLTGDTNWDKAYVVDAYGVIDIPGWRINKDKVAKFVFESKSGAYNQESQQNIGVIGVMEYDKIQPIVSYPLIFTEPYWNNWNNWDDYNYWPKRRNIWYSTLGVGNMPQCSTTNSISSGNAKFNNTYKIDALNAVSSDYTSSKISGKLENVATGWGSEKEFKTIDDNDKFNTISSGSTLIYYDTAKNLEKRGIKLKTNFIERTPQAFPGMNDFGCTPPNKTKTK